jgi:hypothetical protein
MVSVLWTVALGVWSHTPMGKKFGSVHSPFPGVGDVPDAVTGPTLWLVAEALPALLVAVTVTDTIMSTSDAPRVSVCPTVPSDHLYV